MRRRNFLKTAAQAGAGIIFTGCGLVPFARAQGGGAVRRREVSVGGRRIRTVDIHAHCFIPEVWEMVKDYEWGQGVSPTALASGTGRLNSVASLADRLRAMDEQGIDVQVLSINSFWSAAERDLAAQIVKLQNDKIAELCAKYPDRFAGLATISLQFPYLAVEQLEDAHKRLGMRGCAIGGSINGLELSNSRFHPFWAKAEELGSLIFIHPQPGGAPADIEHRLRGNGGLTNVIGNPLETTIALSHLIFEGTLDRFPGLKICGAHGGGYLPSYISRSDRCMTKSPNPCREVTPVKKQPSEYIRQLYFDSMVFTAQGLRHLAAEAGARQIIMGTDYPFGWTNESVDHILNTPGLSDDDKRAMLGETAARLLGLGAVPA
jgi:aminocarboxymuconate-semialdehyde decarboxylase